MISSDTSLPFVLTDALKNENGSNLNVSKRRVIQARIKERKKKILEAHLDHEAICHIRDKILGISKNESSKRAADSERALREKSLEIRERIKKRRELIALAEQEHLEMIQLVNPALMKADQVYQDLMMIKQEQETIQDLMLAIQKDFLMKIKTQTTLSEEKHLKLFQDVALLQKIIEDTLDQFPAMITKLEVLEKDIPQVQMTQKDIQNEILLLFDQSQLISLDHQKLKTRLIALCKEIDATPTNVLEVIAKMEIIGLPTVKEALQKVLTKEGMRRFGKSIGKKFQKVRNFKLKFKKMNALIKEKLKILTLKTIEKIEKLALMIKQFPFKIIPKLLKKAWKWLKNSGIGVKIAFGMIVCYLFRTLIAKKPILSIAIGLYLFLNLC